jgi:hypothetical protein
MLVLNKISKRTKSYNTYFDKDKESEYELQQNKKNNDNFEDLCLIDINEDGLKNRVGCSVRVSGLRRMKQTYYE